MDNQKHIQKVEEEKKSVWKFLVNQIPENSLLLDCRSLENFKKQTIKSAYSAHLIRKPHGSSQKSLLKLSNFLKSILDIASSYNNIVVFDEGLGMFTGKLAFLLRGLNLKNVYILNQIFSEIDDKYKQEGTLVIEEANLKKPLPIKDIVPLSYVQMNLVKVQLIDVRTKEEFEGKLPILVNPEEGSICGKIPGAIHFDWLELYDENGFLHPKQEILKKLKLANLIVERPTILYDFNGARSCFTALVLKECNYRNVKVFLGSWMEWRKTDLPKQNVRIWYPEKYE
ncbi:MAG: sulfurtransferase [Leptonema sp. (in: bacteria)]